MNPDADVADQSMYLVLTMFYLLHFWCSTLHSMKSAQRCTILLMVNVIDTCGAIIFSYVGIAFLLFFMKIENTAYTSFQNNMLLLINGLIFDIINIQNSHCLEFEWIAMLSPLRSVNDSRFSWLQNAFLKSSQDWLNSVEQCQGNFRKVAGWKIFISSQTYEGLEIGVN